MATKINGNDLLYDPSRYSTQGLTDKTAVQNALASAQYTPGAAVNSAAAALKQLEASRPDEYRSSYQSRIDSLLDKTLSQGSFQYNYASDPLYKQYAQAYRQNAHDASTDAAAQAAALTGGYGSSYAASAAQQAYQQQMNGLNSVIPTLYGLALDSYTSEGDLLMDQLGAANTQEQNAQDLYYRQLDDYYTQLDQKQDAYDTAYAQDYARYGDYLSNLNSLYSYYSQQEQAAAARSQQGFNNVMTVLGLIGDVAQFALSGTMGLGSMLSGLLQTGYGIYSDSRDYEASRADTAWSQQMEQLLRQDSLAQQSYKNETAAQQYQDKLAQQQYDNNVTSQKLALARSEWALKKSQAQQEAASASARAASAASGSGTAGGSGSASGGTASGSRASGGGLDYQSIANQMRARGYTIDEIKEMFDVMRESG